MLKFNAIPVGSKFKQMSLDTIWIKSSEEKARVFPHGTDIWFNNSEVRDVEYPADVRPVHFAARDIKKGERIDLKADIETKLLRERVTIDGAIYVLETAIPSDR